MIHQVLVAFDQLLNAILGGMADETLSARAYRMRLKKHRVWGWTADFIDFLFFWQRDEYGYRDHCRRAYLSELERKHLPSFYR